MSETGIHFVDARGPENIVVYAIGDVHGRLDLLTQMHRKIEADLRRRGAPDFRIIHLGDYVDRGPDSRGVIEALAQMRGRSEKVITLAGNHDVGMLEFLARPDADGLFARYGGDATAHSYGVTLDVADPERLRASHRALVAAVPEAHVEFLRTLTYSVSFGDFFYCHAGIRPGLALDQQPRDVLTWIRGEFLSYPQLHPKVIVHGHTPTTVPEEVGNRVNVDTGAYASGRLTALVVAGAEKQFLWVQEPRG